MAIALVARAVLAQGDWDCPQCGDMNFASRQVCRKCGTPHSFAASAGGLEGAAAGPPTGASSLESTGALPDYSARAQEYRPRSRSRSRDRRF